MNLLLILPTVCTMIACSLPINTTPPVKTGADILIERSLPLLQGKRVGIVTNHTGRLSSGAFLVDALLEHKITVVALFGPEHGIRGEAAAGEKIGDVRDPKTGIPVYSLYGAHRKPTMEMLQNVDLLLYDIQDVGARFYTYISTMGLCMEAAAEKGIPFIVLDRPNPLGGILVDGPILEDSLKSFVGMYPIPTVYGLTPGELAQMINGEGWLSVRQRADLRVIPMEGWKRSMRWEETGLPWIAPSPNIPTASTALVYPATCFIEATNLSEGRGTEAPFLMFGAPFVKGDSLAAALNSAGLEWVRFSPARFTPKSSKFSGTPCNGVRVEVVRPSEFHPLLLSAHLYRTLTAAYPDKMTVNRATLGRLMGTVRFREAIEGDESPESFAEGVKAAKARFQEASRRYQLYPAE